MKPYKKLFKETKYYDNTIYYSLYKTNVSPPEGGYFVNTNKTGFKKDITGKSKTKFSIEFMYNLHLDGDTYDVKEELKKLGFSWNNLENSWVYNDFIEIDKKDKILIPIFRKIEKTGVAIAPGSMIHHDDSALVKGYENIKMPPIPHAEPEDKIILKKWHHYAPMFGLYGKCTKKLKNLLKYYHFEYDPKTYGWIKVGKIEHNFLDYLRSYGYKIEEKE